MTDHTLMCLYCSCESADGSARLQLSVGRVLPAAGPALPRPGHPTAGGAGRRPAATTVSPAGSNTHNSWDQVNYTCRNSQYCYTDFQQQKML